MQNYEIFNIPQNNLQYISNKIDLFGGIKAKY